MCGECAGFSANRKPVVRTLIDILNNSKLGVGCIFGSSPTARQGGAVNGFEDPQHIFTCFNCWKIKDSLWIVSQTVDIGVVDECLCCAECLCRNLAEPSFSRETRISLRCGGDGCQLQLDTWTKGSELVISLVREHTLNCPFRPIFCPKGCKAVIRRQDQSLHEGSCLLSTRRFDEESLRMQEVEKRLIVSPSQMRYHQLANVPTTTVRRESAGPLQQARHRGTICSAYVVCGTPHRGQGLAETTKQVQKPPLHNGINGTVLYLNSTPSPYTPTTRIPAPRETPADRHESLRREAMDVSRRSSVVPVIDRTETEVNGSPVQPASRCSGEALRHEALAVSRKSSVPTFSRSISETSSKQLSNGRSNNSPPRTNGVSDETLEQLEKARLALERECIEIPEGVSYLPDVIAQRINNEDVELRDRVEKLEELVATTRAQLEKAFAENRNLRALLASEHKLRELNVTKLRDEVEILRSIVYRQFRQNSNNVTNGNTTNTARSMNGTRPSPV